MNPDNVPAEWVEAALNTRLPSGGLPTLNEPQMRAILAAVLPLAQAAYFASGPFEQKDANPGASGA
jgi:hypothetical protein